MAEARREKKEWNGAKSKTFEWICEEKLRLKKNYHKIGKARLDMFEMDWELVRQFNHGVRAREWNAFDLVEKGFKHEKARLHIPAFGTAKRL